MTQRETHGVRFTQCPQCSMTIGVSGLAAHVKAHGAPAVTETPPPATQRPTLAAVREQAARDMEARMAAYRAQQS